MSYFVSAAPLWLVLVLLIIAVGATISIIKKHPGKNAKAYAILAAFFIIAIPFAYAVKKVYLRGSSGL